MLTACDIVFTGCDAAPQSRETPVDAKREPSFTVIEQTESSASPVSSASAPAKKKRFGEAIVYIDGRAIGVMRHGEMPSSVTPVASSGFPRFRLTDYLTALGVDIAKVREVHLHGGRRASVLKGDELRAHKDDVLFAFNQATRGKPRMEWTDKDVDINTRIDTIANVAVYQDKPAPQIMLARRGPYLAFEEGKPIDGVAYAPKEKIVQGTRAYVDGKLVGTAKRKTIPDTFVVPGSSPARFRFVPYLESLGVSFKGARTVELIDGDDTLARIDGAKWSEMASSLEFTLPPGSQGHLVVDLGRFREGGDGKLARVSALLVHRTTSPRSEALVDLADVALPSGNQDSAPNPTEAEP